MIHNNHALFHTGHTVLAAGAAGRYMAVTASALALLHFHW
jgi:hypothetical protein